MRMNFVQDATAKIEGLTSRKSRFLQEADWAKVTADAAAELCGIALNQQKALGFTGQFAFGERSRSILLTF